MTKQLTSDFNELVLLNNILHFLLFLLPLNSIFLHIANLVGDILETISIMRAESQTSHKVC